MGKAQSKHDERDDEVLQKAKRIIEEKGVMGAQDVMREKLEGWRDVKVKIGVTGFTGVGKSSFINAFRGYGYFDYQYLSYFGILCSCDSRGDINEAEFFFFERTIL